MSVHFARDRLVGQSNDYVHCCMYDFNRCLFTALEMVKLHEEYVAPKIISLGEQTVKDGTPIIRPLWWYAALDKETYTIEDQFMIGEICLELDLEEFGNNNCQLVAKTSGDMRIQGLSFNYILRI